MTALVLFIISPIHLYHLLVYKKEYIILIKKDINIVFINSMKLNFFKINLLCMFNKLIRYTNFILSTMSSIKHF